MPLRPVMPGSVQALPAGDDARSVARRVWVAWTGGWAPGTVSCRRSDLALFGDFTWRAREEIAVIRRVIASLARGLESFRELAVAWSAHERDAGVAFHTRTRHWGTLAQLVIAIGETLPRRGSPSPVLGAMPREDAPAIDRAGAEAAIARALDRGAHEDALILALALELDDEKIAAMRVSDLRALEPDACDAVRVAIARVCLGRRGNAHAFEGRSRGKAITAQGVRMRCEKNGTTAAALRRAAKGER